jgi:hypothetical protein
MNKNSKKIVALGNYVASFYSLIQKELSIRMLDVCCGVLINVVASLTHLDMIFTGLFITKSSR